ncbi:MAG: hypothetical protein ACFBSC_02055 [Microcoleaceae cyanobacterium]
MSMFSKIVRPFTRRFVRSLIATSICVALVFSGAVPALAAKSNPQEGEASLNQVQEKSEKILDRKNPPGYENKNKTTTTEGLNMVQGSANKEKMKTDRNSNATSVEEKIEKGLDQLTN